MNQKSVKALRKFVRSALKYGLVFNWKQLKKTYKRMNTIKRRQFKLMMNSVKDIEVFKKLQSLIKK